MRPCNEDGCPELVVRGRCPEHAAANEGRRGLRYPWRWVYADPRWRRCRGRALVRAGFRCQVVEGGARCTVRDRSGAGLHGHHAYPGGVSALLAAGLDPFDDELVRCVCAAHHQRLELEDRNARRQAPRPRRRSQFA